MSDYTGLTDEQAVGIVQDLLLLEDDSSVPMATLQVGPFTCYAIVATVQLACRHPALQDGPLREHVERVARTIQEAMPPAARAILERGWDVAQDA